MCACSVLLLRVVVLYFEMIVSVVVVRCFVVLCVLCLFCVCCVCVVSVWLLRVCWYSVVCYCSGLSCPVFVFVCVRVSLCRRLYSSVYGIVQGCMV